MFAITEQQPRRCVSTGLAEASQTGKALAKPRPVPAPTNVQWLAARLRPTIWLHARVQVCTTLASLLALLDPLIMKWLIDDVLARRRMNVVPVVAGAFVANYIARRLLDYAATMVGARAMHQVMFALRRAMIRTVYRLSASCLNRRSVGDTQHRIEQDVTQIGTIGSEIIPSVVRLVTMSVAVLTAMLILNPTLAALVLPLAPAFVFLRARYKRELEERSDAVQARSAAGASFLQEHLDGAIQVQLLGREAATSRRFASLSTAAIRADLRRRHSELVFGSAMYLVVVCGMAGVLGVGGYQVLAGTLTTGGLVAFYGYTLQLFIPLYTLVDLYSRTQRVSASVGRVRQLLDDPDTIQEHPEAVPLQRSGAAAVEMRGVTFAYEQGPLVLDEIDLRVAPGERVALSGPSGCGKSTVARLIARLYDPRSGAVLVDGVDVRNVTRRSLRAAVSYVPQDTFLFDASIEDNIRYGNPHVDADELEKVAWIVQLRPVLDRLGAGWTESPGARGCRLSGGERQRIALARALVAHPRLLILDESTSALDELTELRVLDALGAALRDTTVICISHRPAVLRWAERVLELRAGQLVQDDDRLIAEA